MKKFLSFVLALMLVLTSLPLVSIVAANEATGTFEGAVLNIGSSLTFDYFATFNVDAEDVTVRFSSSSGRITEVKGVFDDAQQMYKFSYTGINPQCMTDEISAELLYKGKVLDQKEEYSVKTYCENLMEKTADELGYNSTQFNAFITLMADMLVYGSEAQKYKNYNTENLADSSTWVKSLASEFLKPASVKTVSGNNDANNRVIALGVNMSNVNKVYFKLQLTDDVTITLNGKNIDRSDLVDNGDGILVLYSEEIKATGFDDVYTLTLTKAGKVISTVSYNVNAYVVSKYNSKSVGDIVKALSNYGLSAEKYVKAIKAQTEGGDFDLEDEDVLTEEVSKNLIPYKASTFEGATTYQQAGWGTIGSPAITIVSDDYGNCMKLDHGGSDYSSPMLNIAPYITEAGEYTVSFKYKVVGANPEGKSFSGIVRTNGENSFSSYNNNKTLTYCTLKGSGTVEENTWETFTDSFYVEHSDIATPNNVGAPWRLGLHSINIATVTEIYIDDVTLVKTGTKHVTEAETWVAEEIILTTDKFYADPFNEVELDLILTNGKTTLTIPGFWDGVDLWKVRFACTEAGVWTYTTKCSDTSNTDLHNVTGALVCKEYSGDLDIYKHGFVRTETGKNYFVYDDGTPFFYLGDTHWGLGTETQDMVETIASLRAEQGYTVYQSQPIGASFNLTDGLTRKDVEGFKSFDEKFQYIASVGLLHTNSQFIFPSSMSELIANNGGYTDNLLQSVTKYKEKLDENGNVVKNENDEPVMVSTTAELYELSSEVKTYLEKISRYWVARYSAYPVMWTLGQEVDRDFFFTQTADAHGHLDWGMANNPYKFIAEYLYKYDPYKHSLSAHQEGSSYTDSQNSSFRDVTGHTWWATQWKPSITAEKQETLHTKAKTFAQYSQGKPLINYEPYYVWLQTKNFGGRAQGWMSFLSGFAGHAYGAQDTWAYKNEYLERETKCYDGVDTNTSEEKTNAVWQDALEYPASFQLTYMKKFLTGTVGQWYSLIPRYDDTKYLERDEGALAVIASASDHRKIVIYFYNFDNTDELTVGKKPNAAGFGTATGTLKNLSANTKYNYMWFNPITGVKTYGSFTSTASGTWDIPDKAMQDMVLYVYNR